MRIAACYHPREEPGAGKPHAGICECCVVASDGEGEAYTAPPKRFPAVPSSHGSRIALDQRGKIIRRSPRSADRSSNRHSRRSSAAQRLAGPRFAPLEGSAAGAPARLTARAMGRRLKPFTGTVIAESPGFAPRRGWQARICRLHPLTFELRFESIMQINCREPEDAPSSSDNRRHFREPGVS
jgi:hypothetical protein